MRRYKDVYVARGCALDKALDDKDMRRAEAIYSEAMREFYKHVPRDFPARMSSFHPEWEHVQA